MTQNHQCLNCESTLQAAQNFCSTCGQRTSTHRFSLKGIFSHDFVHAVFHLDKGFFFTLKMVLIHPGFFIKEFLDGKRMKYFNYFTFILLLIAFGHLLSLYNHVKISDLMDMQVQKQMMNKLQDFMTNNPKLIYVIMVPIASLCTFIWFINQNLNFSEHLILNIYKAGGEIFIGCFFSLFCIAMPNIAILKKVYPWFTVLSMSYGVWVYYSFFKQYLKNKWYVFFQSIGAIVTNLLVYSILSVIVGIAYGYLSTKK